MYYWTTNRYFKVETALLQFLSNLDYKNSFVYWTKGGLLKCDSYFTGYQQPTELYAFISSRVTLKFSTHVWGRHDRKSWCYVAIGDEVKHDNLMSNESIL